MQPEVPRLHSQASATGPYPKPDKSSSQSDTPIAYI
jgi:hypothetical protein